MSNPLISPQSRRLSFALGVVVFCQLINFYVPADFGSVASSDIVTKAVDGATDIR